MRRTYKRFSKLIVKQILPDFQVPINLLKLKSQSKRFRHWENRRSAKYKISQSEFINFFPALTLNFHFVSTLTEKRGV